MAGTSQVAEGAEPGEGEEALLRACPEQEGRSLEAAGEQTEAYEAVKQRQWYNIE